MSRRLRIERGLIAFSLATLFGVSAAHADLLTYENSRFGTRVSFPAEMFDTRMEPPANGDGMTWTAQDGGSIAVYASNNALMVDEAGLLADLRQNQPGITYSASGDGWVVVSGIEDGLIYYQRIVFGSDDVLHGVLMRYPVAEKPRYDAAVKPIMDSLSIP